MGYSFEKQPDGKYKMVKQKPKFKKPSTNEMVMKAMDEHAKELKGEKHMMPDKHKEMGKDGSKEHEMGESSKKEMEEHKKGMEPKGK